MYNNKSNINNAVQLLSRNIVSMLLLLLFVNTTVISQYVDLNLFGIVTTELCEEEEDAIEESDFEINLFEHALYFTSPDMITENTTPFFSELLEYYNEVFTPPPEASVL